MTTEHQPHPESSMRQIALAYYLGKQGNCAQSVTYALQQRGIATQEAIEQMALYGSGRAPDRMCGALYAAVSQAPNPASALEIQKRFEAASGGFFRCPQIRVAKKLSCQQCVELAAELLEQQMA